MSDGGSRGSMRGDRGDWPDSSCLTQFDLLAAILLSTDECRLSLVPRLAAIEMALTGHDACARLLASMRAEYSGPRRSRPL